METEIFLLVKLLQENSHHLTASEILLSHNQSKSNYLLMHGDQLCTDDKEHQEFRKMVLSANGEISF